MKVYKVLILCIIVGLITIPAVSAEKRDSKNAKTKVILDFNGKDYIFSL